MEQDFFVAYEVVGKLLFTLQGGGICDRIFLSCVMKISVI